MRAFTATATALLMMTTMLWSQQPAGPETADQILGKAFTQAKNEGKNVILMFHASWCGWCKKMDASLADESCREFFDKNYIITHLVVLESAANKHLENPGAKEIYDKYSGGGGGIPFWLIYDSSGKVLEDSMMETTGRDGKPSRGNIGCPASDEEVEQFTKKLKRTSRLTDDQLSVIAERFKKNRN